MNILLIVLIILSPFLVVVFFGAPFVRTLKSQREHILDAFELKKGDVVLDLGAGDASVVLALAQQGFTAIGYEINPFLFAIGWLRCLRYDNASMRLANYWSAPFPDDTKGVFIFSAGRFMPRLVTKLKNERPNGVQLVSFAFELPGHAPDKTVEGLHLYRL